MGDLVTADRIDDLGNSFEIDPSNQQSEKSIESELKSYEDRYQSYSLQFNTTSVDMHLKSIQRDAIETFWKAILITKKCDSCGSYSPGLRKDGYTKIFIKPLPKKMRDSMGKQSV